MRWLSGNKETLLKWKAKENMSCLKDSTHASQCKVRKPAIKNTKETTRVAFIVIYWNMVKSLVKCCTVVYVLPDLWCVIISFSNMNNTLLINLCDLMGCVFQKHKMWSIKFDSWTCMLGQLNYIVSESNDWHHNFSNYLLQFFLNHTLKNILNTVYDNNKIQPVVIWTFPLVCIRSLFLTDSRT